MEALLAMLSIQLRWVILPGLLFVLLVLPVLSVTAEEGGRAVSGNCKNGTGTMVWPSGARYTGAFKNGQPQGRGDYRYADGGRYIGELRRGKRHGQGVYKWTSGARYEGEFRNDRRYGYGEMRYSDGREFEGKWRRNNPSEGTMEFPDGRVYEGSFQEARPHGKGVMTDKDGVQHYGRFAGGRIVKEEATRFINTPFELAIIPSSSVVYNEDEKFLDTTGFYVSGCWSFIRNKHWAVQLHAALGYQQVAWSDGESSGAREEGLEFVSHLRVLVRFHKRFSAGIDFGWLNNRDNQGNFRNELILGPAVQMRLNKNFSVGVEYHLVPGQIDWLLKGSSFDQRLNLRFAWHL